MSDQDVKKEGLWGRIKNLLAGGEQGQVKEILFNYQGSLKIEKERKESGAGKAPMIGVEEMRDQVKSKKSDQQSRLYAAEKKNPPKVDEKESARVLGDLSSIQEKKNKEEFLPPSNNEKKAPTVIQPPKDKWKAPVVLETNLIRDEVTTFFEWSKNLRKLAVRLIFSSFLVSACYGGLLFYEKLSSKQGEDMSAQIEAVRKAIVDLEGKKKEADDFREKMDTVNTLLSHHVYWTNFFSFLEANILPSVTINDNFSGTIDGKYQLSAKTGSFVELSDQVRVLRDNENVESVSVLSAELSEVEDKSSAVLDEKNAESSDQSIKKEVKKKDEVSFVMEIQVKKSLFLR